jgi:lambda repressor-like predicted transcriptional regulator
MENYNSDQRRTAIKLFMEKHGLKVAPWCAKAKLSEGTLRNFLKGMSNSLTDRTISKLAHAQNVTIAEILGDDTNHGIINRINELDDAERAELDSFLDYLENKI